MLQKHLVIVPFRSRRGFNASIRPVNRIKHVTDKQAGVVLNNQEIVIIAKSVDSPILANSNECEIGSTINGIFINAECYATSAAGLANVYFMVAKNPGNNLVFPNPNVIGASDEKRFVIHQEMVMLNEVVKGNPRTLFKGVVVIPRGYRRMGPKDQIVIIVFAPGVNINLCIQTHYKEFN